MADDKKIEKHGGEKKGGAGTRGSGGWKKPEKKKFKPYRKLRMCPKCGTGTRLAEHPNRYSCGKCGYMENKGRT